MKAFICVAVLLIPLSAFASQGSLSPGYYVCEAMALERHDPIL